MKIMFIKKGILIALMSSSLLASGDNKVTMTDIKEALYNLVISSDKNDQSIKKLNTQVAELSSVPPAVERNTKNISIMADRLNELGVQTNPLASSSVTSEISQFVSQNRQFLPQDARGVK